MIDYQCNTFMILRKGNLKIFLIDEHKKKRGQS